MIGPHVHMGPIKIELWAPYTIWQAVLKGQVILRQKANFEPD